MLRSPISPASFCTFARSSSRNTTSSGESGPALETFFPGILIPNHQSNTKTATTTMVMRSAREKIFKSTLVNYERCLAKRVREHVPGSARVSRVGFGVAPKQSLHKRMQPHARRNYQREVRDREDALASTRDACATQTSVHHASFFRNRRAHRLKSRFDITISTKRFGQYSKKFAPRRMIARISAMKYVVGNSAPSA